MVKEVNKKMQNKKHPVPLQRGFTLIELLVVVSVVGLVAVTATSIFFAVSRSQKQAEVRQAIKEDGNYTLTVMGRLIRSAISIDDCVSSFSNPQLELTSPDGYRTSFTCSSDLIASDSANSTSLIDVEDFAGSVVIICDDFVTCNGSDEVEINFELKAGDEASALPYQQATLKFNSTFNPRNLR